MKKKLYFVANFHFNMEDNVYAYNSWSSFGDIGKVLHLPLSGFSFMQCKKKRHWEMPGLLKMFLLQKKRLSWISKKASDISPKRILGYTNQYRVFRRHKSIKAWKWLRTKVLVFFCENEKLTHISLPYNIFFKKNVAGLIFLYKWCKLLLLSHPLDICCCNDTIL